MHQPQILIKYNRIGISRTLARVVVTAICLFIPTGFAAEMPKLPAGHPLFATSRHCIACHSNIQGSDGGDVSIGWQWRATMMGNASRDPYWQASVRREIIDHPAAQSDIEDTCSTCHMPMQRYQAHVEGLRGGVLRYLDAIRRGTAATEPEATLAKAADPMATLAADGVSCTVCHQILPDNLGTKASFDGGFLVDRQKPLEQRLLFGRFDVDQGRAAAMHSATGFKQTQADHLQRSELCASCHTLFTKALDDQGKPAGTLPEQVPFLEWQHSDFSQGKSCQSCHMPNAGGEVQISSVLGQARANVPQHVFVGGNAFLLRMLKNHNTELGVIAPPEDLEASAVRTEQQLSGQTATVAIGKIAMTGGHLGFEVTVTNLTGHKLPTAYPARRVWLHVLVRDAHGFPIFESGAMRADGSIVGNDNDEDASRFEPHYARITRADQVQLYESVMGDYAGRVTTGLLYGTHYLKDNRLLPAGFDKSTADPEIAVKGTAMQDRDFTGGSDTVSYNVGPVQKAGRFSVTVELLYQSVGFRWAQNLRNYSAQEPQRFLHYFDEQADASSKLLARASFISKPDGL